MDTIKSITGYFKFDEEQQDLASKRKSKKRIISYSLIGALATALIIVCVVKGVEHSRKNHSSNSSQNGSNSELTPATSLKAVCSVTPYPDSCVSSISKIPSSTTTTDPVSLFKLSLKVVVDELVSISVLPKKLADEIDNERMKSSLDVCALVFDTALDSLDRTVSAMEMDKILNSTKINNIQTWLTSAAADHETCLDALDELPASTITQNLKSAMSNSTEYTRNSLAIVAKILSTLIDVAIKPTHQRRLLKADSFPAWVGQGARRLLEDTYAPRLPNVTVAADGSGDVKTVNEAVARVQNKSDTYFIIYVKAGTYLENVEIDKNKWNVMLYGDGIGKTIISGSRSNHSGHSTYNTATLGVEGRSFIMQNISIINTAGPRMAQAVAFRSRSDSSVYYQCSFDGYQDTLYPHSNRQFYRNCDVTGTVDFIFGYSAVVFQYCSIRPRQPLPGQSNTITAHGRSNSSENSGFSIQRCTISANGIVTAPTYLGRPWKYLAVTVVMETEIGSVVKPDGWLAWNGSSGMFYGEYKNSGPGSSVGQRVNWDGRYEPVMTEAQAAKYTVTKLIDGNEWLPSTGLPFSPY